MRWAHAGTYEGTYIGMLDHNITLVARGLGGQAPERGMLGKLSKEKIGVCRDRHSRKPTRTFAAS